MKSAEQRKQQQIVKRLKPRKCKACGSEFQPMSGLSRACTLECALKLVRLRQQRDHDRAFRVERVRLKTLSELCQESQRVVNQFVRKRDEAKGYGCICCGKPIDDAGHFFPIGSKYRLSRIRFDPRQIHGCCAKCNRFTGGGNVRAYEEGFIHRYGQDAFDELLALKRCADTGGLNPLTKEEVVAIKKEYQLKLRELRKRDRDCENDKRKYLP